MKKIWKYVLSKPFAVVVLSILFQSGKANAQITLEAMIDTSSYPSLWRFVQISPTETKYFFTDTVNQSFSLYNMDFTPFITNIPVPDPWAWNSLSHFEAYYITRTLFDCDTTNIEFVFAAPTNPNKLFRIIRTDGTILFQQDSSFLGYCYGDCGNGGAVPIASIANTSSGTKMVLTHFTSASTEQDFIYALCGTLPTDVYDLTQQKQSYVSIFPNPSSASLTFKINPPDNVHEYELVIIDSNANEVKREKVNSLNRNYIMNVSNMSSGTYFYLLCTKNKSYQSGKFIITK